MPVRRQGHLNKKLKPLVSKTSLFWRLSLKGNSQRLLTQLNRRFGHKVFSILGASRVRASRHQAPVGLREGALQADREVRPAGGLVDSTSQPLSVEANLNELMGRIWPAYPERYVRALKSLETQ